MAETSYVPLMTTNVPRKNRPSRPLRYATRFRPSGMSRLERDGGIGVDAPSETVTLKRLPSTRDAYALYSRNGPTRKPGK
jgi:hypothetical protein